MSDPYEVVASPVFHTSLKKLCAFLRRKHDERVAEQTRDTIQRRVVELSNDPYLAPVSDRLVALGLIEYRQLLVDQHNLIFYRVDNQERKVILITAIDSRQSIEQLLYEVNINLE